MSRKNFELKKNQWVPIEERKPEKYELVRVQYKNKLEDYGWWTGTYWDGRRRIDQDNLVLWKLLGGYKHGIQD